MISVDSVYQKVRQISLKESAGYSSPADFNAQQRVVQDMLFEWYFRRYEIDQRIPDSLAPFYKESIATIMVGEVSYPDDYRHRIEVQVGYVSQGTTTYHACPHIAEKEEAESQRTVVRRASATKRRFYHRLLSESIAILPSNFNGRVKLKYFAQPADAIWGATLDAVNNVYNYDAGTSTDFLWRPQDETNLVDLFLYLKGIQTRTSELLEWVGQKNQLSYNKV